MAELKFEWDEAKDKANRRKHGVAFVEACTVFSDERALLLVVHHTLRAGGDVLRIISARKATRNERDQSIRR
jgi:uncharacterized protein